MKILKGAGVVVMILAIAAVCFGSRFLAGEAEKAERAKVGVYTCPNGTSAVVVDDVFVNQWAVSPTVTIDGVKRDVSSATMRMSLLESGDTICVKDAIVGETWPVDIVALVVEQPADKEDTFVPPDNR
jgi:hypothetical protein